MIFPLICVFNVKLFGRIWRAIKHTYITAFYLNPNYKVIIQLIDIYWKCPLCCSKAFTFLIFCFHLYFNRNNNQKKVRSHKNIIKCVVLTSSIYSVSKPPYLVARIVKAYEHKLYSMGCFIDIDEAFNNMIYKSIAKTCADHGVDNTSIGWITQMLKSRVVSTYLGSTKVTMYPRKGCPQGGILPPLLYCLVKDSLLSLLNDVGFYTQGFADDLATLIIGHCLPTISRLMQTALNLVQDWCLEHEDKSCTIFILP